MAFYDRRICGFTPSESLLFVAIVTMVFLRVTLVGAAVALPRHHMRSNSPAAMVRGCGIRASANELNIAAISNLVLYSGEVFCRAGVLAGTSDEFTFFRDFFTPLCRSVSTAQPISATDAGRSAAESCILREESLPFISASSLSSPICLQTVEHFTRLSGFGPSLDGLQPTASTPRLS